jgi:hypothetical protein
MMKNSFFFKRSSLVLISVSVVSLGAIGFFIQQSNSSSRVVLKDELQIHRKLLHNAETEHGCDCFSPFISGFAISKITSTGASIAWNCDAPSSYQVKYGTTTAKSSTFPTATPTAPYKTYTVVLTGLQPATVYHIGPTSICLNSCTRNASAGLRRTYDVNGKSDWTFTTLPKTSVLENPIETRETARTAISAVNVAEITAKEVTIAWKTNNPATSLIEYGKTTAYGVKTEQNTIAERDHVIQLFDLQFGTTYHARAVSNDPATGKSICSADFTFTTPTSETRIVNPSAVFNEPNPCFSRTVFTYYLYQTVQRMTIDILTLSGKTVATLESPQGTLKEGYNKVLWDLRGNTQNRLPNGVYVYKIKFYVANNQIEEVSKSNLTIRR